ncbi:mCG134795, isoform CRA_b, partial [Mus musculus]
MIFLQVRVPQILLSDLWFQGIPLRMEARKQCLKSSLYLICSSIKPMLWN